MSFVEPRHQPNHFPKRAHHPTASILQQQGDFRRPIPMGCPTQNAPELRHQKPYSMRPTVRRKNHPTNRQQSSRNPIAPHPERWPAVLLQAIRRRHPARRSNPWLPVHPPSTAIACVRGHFPIRVQTMFPWSCRSLHRSIPLQIARNYCTSNARCPQELVPPQ